MEDMIPIRCHQNVQLGRAVFEGRDRAGNAFPYLVVTLPEGTEIQRVYQRDAHNNITGEVATFLEQPVQVVLRLAPWHLAMLAIRAQASRRGDAKAGPVTAKRTTLHVRTRTAPVTR